MASKLSMRSMFRELPLGVPAREALREFNKIASESDQHLSGGYADAKADSSEATTSKIARLVALVRENYGIEEDNYLPWVESFGAGTGYVDRIKPSDLGKRNVVWFVTPDHRIGFAAHIIAENAQAVKKRGVVIFFQRHPGQQLLVSAGHCSPICFGPLEDETNFSRIIRLLNRRGEFTTKDDMHAHLATREEIMDDTIETYKL